MWHSPIAYSYEADTHCPNCTEERFGRAQDGSIAEHAVDAEGNDIHPLAPWDEWQRYTGEHETLACGTCGEVIDDYDPK